MEKSCDMKIKDSKEAKICEGQYREWMRVQGRLLGRQEGRSDGFMGKKVDLGKELVVVEQDQRQMSEQVKGKVEIKGGIPVIKDPVGEGFELSQAPFVGRLDREIMGGGDKAELTSSEEGKQNPDLGASKQEIGKDGGEVMELDGVSGSGLSGRSGLTVLDQNRIDESGEMKTGTSVTTKGSWKRTGRISTGKAGNCCGKGKENEGMTGNKRFRLCDEEDQSEMDVQVEKRERTGYDLRVKNNVKVGVASLKWPQSIQ